MDMVEVLRRSGGIDAIAGQLGINPAVASVGAEALLPAIVGGFKKRSQTGGASDVGIGDLIGMLSGLGGGALAGNVLSPEPTDIARGNDVLGQIFGSKDVSRTVAAQASQNSGIDAGVLKKMLPILAMLVGGYLSAKSGSSSDGSAQDGGGLGDLLGSILGGSPSAKGAGLGGLGSLLDLDGDGNPLDDIIAMASKLRG